MPRLCCSIFRQTSPVDGIMRHRKSTLIFLSALCLFAGAGSAVSGVTQGPYLAGLRRLTESQYRNSIADIFGAGIVVQGRFEPDRRVGGLLAASGATLSITPAGFEGYAKVADSIAKQVVDEKNRAKLISCSPKSDVAPDRDCASQIISQYGLQLFRRPLSPEELKTRLDAADTATRLSNSFYTGIGYSLTTLLSAPDFLFRPEIAIRTAKGYTLDGYSRAARLSYMLWDTTPDAELLNAARTGVLDTEAGVKPQAARLMASPRLETGMRAFFSDFLELDTLGTITKDPTIYPKYNDQVAASAREETLRTAIDLTLKTDGDFRDIFTTRKTVINRQLAWIYDVPYNLDGGWMPYEFQEGSGRSGIVTQAAILSMFSHPGRSSPTKRGVALLDIFVCEPTPAPPANVDFSIVNDTKNPARQTVRDRLMAHATDSACASCHTHSDPLGLALEQFDSVGERRLKYDGHEIDVSASIANKHFVGGTGLGQYLHDNPKVPACLVRKLYAYGVGADSEDMDKHAIQPFLDGFMAGGYRLPSLLKSIVTSPQFFSAPEPAGNLPKLSLNATAH
jgi:Protein of unknown function (DUF1592)/Protein of unknown function (DUF1588)/Protein of unknown function (DUF1585)/Protein of unknown function (DUF1587)/Protein of unknown function (DUF1595)